jgi:hypothetical protein
MQKNNSTDEVTALDLAAGFESHSVWNGPNLLFGTNVHFITYSTSSRDLPMGDEFKNEVFRSFEPNPVRTCSSCGEQPALALSMLNPQNGRTVRMFKCECGEQTWSEDKK